MNELTEIDGVILSCRAINRLKLLQEDNNAGIGELTKVIQKGIRTILIHLDNYNQEEKERVEHLLVELSTTCDWIEDLSRP